MRKLFFFASAFAAVIATSCGSRSGEASTNLPASNTPINVTNLQQPSQGNSPAASNVPVVNTAQPASSGTIVPATSATTGLNPAHGQPGHRCDIAVGAPLNSAPAAQTVTTNPAPTNNQAPLIVNKSQPVPTATKPTTAAGLNPAHGQPGHRCDIAVGAPLNSAPATTTNNAATNLKPSITNTTPVITKTAPATAAAVAPGMNPAHGQPGHRCDIAVGAPLNSAPASASTPSVVPAGTNEAKKPVIQTQAPAKKEN